MPPPSAQPPPRAIGCVWFSVQQAKGAFGFDKTTIGLTFRFPAIGFAISPSASVVRTAVKDCSPFGLGF
ncbi:hypothetical protein Tco_0828264 [Tanacetum coccineum]